MPRQDLGIRFQIWKAVEGLVYVPHTEKEYHQLVALLDDLIDEIGEHETHPLALLMEVIGVLIDRYENEHIPALLRE